VSDRRDPGVLVSQMRAGDRVALSRLLSLVEEQTESAELVDQLVKGSWPSLVVGVTGAPGAGKSTLTDSLVSAFRSNGSTVAVLAIDPSSPFTGGAILGDRVRMTTHAGDDGVFVRSLASRGVSGGLAVAVPGSLRVLGAAGFGVVIVETVGVGQIELDSANTCDCVAVVVNPGWGDEVQAVKAGLLEIADIFVVNKSDLPGAAQTESDLRAARSLSTHMNTVRSESWDVPVVQTIAISGDGVGQLKQMIEHFGEWLDQSGQRAMRHHHRTEHELAARVRAEFARLADQQLSGIEYQRVVQLMGAGTITVGEAVAALTKAQVGQQVGQKVGQLRP
jgi:LAO/AO transport system kinase